jgi:outer membrane protein OmpA-like peptidoglycan-associated protein
VALSELENLKRFLEMNPTVDIEIRGHTDNIGDDKSNLELSDNRARVVHEWLAQQGIEADRIRYRGFGEQQPVADNATEEGRRLNRRTEIYIRSL